MIVIGIDPGTASTGYGIIHADKSGEIFLLNYGVITTESTLQADQRLVCIYNEINQIINKYRPSNAAIEKLFMQRNVTNAISVGQARGVVMLAFAQANITTYEYTPTAVKNGITGYGKAEKIQIQNMVANILHMEKIPKPDDAADALAVAICHVNSVDYQRLIMENHDHK